ncbi:MAG TPA: hypothetical protein VEA16_18440 [Vicinamibacterales bacterium]|nr:hypothetical protein [Vicinamibacterales bacterium]
MARRWAAGLAGGCAIAALLWPGHLAGPLDGAPLDQPAEAILIGLAAPILWWLHPDFLRHRIAQLLIVALIAAKAASLPLARDGWCVQFDTAKPLVTDAAGRIHTWDARADWRAAAPQCSAILTRPYREYKEFPVWFFNMPPTDNNLPRYEDRPPGAVLDMTVAGYLHADARGEFIVETGPTMTTTMVIDGRAVEPISPGRHQVFVEAGRHFIQIKSTLTHTRWAFVPLWNGHPIGSRQFATATTRVPSAGDRRIRGVLSWLTHITAAALLVGWLAAFVVWWRDPMTLGFAAVAGTVVWWLGAHPYENYVMTPWALWSITALGVAIAVSVPASKQTLAGAFVLIGIPWLAFVTGVHASHIGRFSLYAGGDDMWMFQRWAYRIYLQGYWLQGGELTFWFQPLYRWVAGALHMVFGDSSMGEFWWDAIGLMAGALLAHQVVAATFGFRWGLAAATLALTVVMHSPTWLYLGIGLSDGASAAFIYLAALVMSSARLRGDVSPITAIGAGVLAALGFYTRLNNLPMALAVAAFAIPLTVHTTRWWQVTRWLPLVSWKGVVGVASVIMLAIFLFTLRTYYYTGVFSFFHGTTWGNHALWQSGHSLSQNLGAMLSSVMMVLTFNDPPRFAWYALPLLIAAVVAALSLLGVRRLIVPLPLALFFAVACSGALAARGVAYAGRFSVHLIGAACALTICLVASLARHFGSCRSSDPARE